jgi:ribosomal protein S18 acetylase RimI-like enzyme
MQMREATMADWDKIWPIFREVVSAGDTYAYPADISRDEAGKIWIDKPTRTFLAEEGGEVLGTYYLKTNHDGPGNHVCNCGYMVSSVARGKGLATKMCEHSQELARQSGYKAMQFNFVASSNEGAVRLWLKLGFEVVGTLPKAFNHPKKGFVDAFVMYKWLSD